MYIIFRACRFLCHIYLFFNARIYSFVNASFGKENGAPKDYIPDRHQTRGTHIARRILHTVRARAFFKRA